VGNRTRYEGTQLQPSVGRIIDIGKINSTGPVPSVDIWIDAIAVVTIQSRPASLAMAVADMTRIARLDERAVSKRHMIAVAAADL
jgi:hypothetical protein